MVMLYLDHAATAQLRAPEVASAMTAALAAANPGRSGHQASLDAARIVFRARAALAGHFGVEDPRRVVFTSGCTAAINTVLFGILRPGDRVVTTAMEHNAVARPLRALEAGRGVTVEVIGTDAEGRVDSMALAGPRPALPWPLSTMSPTTVRTCYINFHEKFALTYIFLPFFPLPIVLKPSVENLEEHN